MSTERRASIAWEIVRRVDTVALCTVEEVDQIHERAQTGEFDNIFSDEDTSSAARRP